MRMAAGYLMMVLAVIGVVVPILPTVPFLLAGAALLGREHPLIRPFMQRLNNWRKPKS